MYTNSMLDLAGAAQLLREARLDFPTSGELRSIVGEPGFDRARDARTWRRADGSTAAFALLWRDWDLLVLVGASDAATAESALAWGWRRAFEVGPKPGKPVTLRVQPLESDEGLIAALERQGFVRES